MLRWKVAPERETLRHRNIRAEICPGFESDLKLTILETQRREHQPRREDQERTEPNKIPSHRSLGPRQSLVFHFHRPSPGKQHDSDEQDQKDQIRRDQRLTGFVKCNGGEKSDPGAE